MINCNSLVSAIISIILVSCSSEKDIKPIWDLFDSAYTEYFENGDLAFDHIENCLMEAGGLSHQIPDYRQTEFRRQEAYTIALLYCISINTKDADNILKYGEIIQNNEDITDRVRLGLNLDSSESVSPEDICRWITELMDFFESRGSQKSSGLDS